MCVLLVRGIWFSRDVLPVTRCNILIPPSLVQFQLWHSFREGKYKVKNECKLASGEGRFVYLEAGEYVSVNHYSWSGRESGQFYSEQVFCTELTSHVVHEKRRVFVSLLHSNFGPCYLMLWWVFCYFVTSDCIFCLDG